ncbi:alpha/beta fold hydrolase [Actinomycetospora lemnae]|uniref:Alpha/beta hydrolase n=1 Tax=Actinomycetospora lemnae TaxID=3019891 RepID=A0ABT5SU81_9PSEU|nr:alpha/beta hydrolase [Actinomycetospora sp. DW7H6]MDD7965582.1 alpha/beta hydrolase [Actinomycetospora sp. DW7H6]
MSLLDRHVLVDGVRLAYRDRGEGEPVVFVHGTPSYSHEWRHVVPAVEAAGHRVITYDLLGYGDSERPLDRDTSVAAQTDLLLALLDELGVTHPTLITHDIGGAIGQRVAVLHPGTARRLMLIDTVSYDSWPSETWQEIIRNRHEDDAGMSAQDFEAMMTRQLTMTVADESVMSGAELAAFLAPHRTSIGRTSFFEHQVRHYDSRYTEELTDRLGEIAVPVRIVWGRADRWQPVSYAERLAKDIPGAELVVVDGAGHFLMEDDPDRLTREVLDFLAGP